MILETASTSQGAKIQVSLRDLDAGKQQVRDTHFQSWGV